MSSTIITKENNCLCEVCGIGFYKYQKTRTCGLNCQRKLMSKMYKGKMTDKHKKRLSDSHKGQKAWNKGIKGLQEWHNIEGLLNAPAWNKGKVCEYLIGNKHAVGHIPWHKGKKTGIVPRSAFKKGENMGSKNSAWKGGVSGIRKIVRTSVDYSEWRTSVFEKDNYTCQHCGDRSGVGKKVYIEADHYPMLFSEIMDKYKITTMKQARKINILWNIDNGRTLCKECHYKVTFNKR